MKFKRPLVIFAALLMCCLALSACSLEGFETIEGGERYEPQKGIHFNYNNIISGSGDYWIEGDAIYTTAGIDIIDHNGRRPFLEKTTTIAFPFQIYGDKCYDIHCIGQGREGIRAYTFCEYDLETMALLRAVTLPSLSDGVFYLKYLVVDNSVYVWTKDYEITVVNLDTNATYKIIKDNIVGVGAHEDSFYYVTSTELRSNGILSDLFNTKPANTYQIKIFEITEDSPLPVDSIASFEHKFDHGTQLESINFTSEGMSFLHKDYNEYNDSIVFYDFETASKRQTMLGFDVDEAVAFDKYMFISEQVSDADENAHQTILHRMHISSGEYESICGFDAYAIKLFVTSDKDAFASGDMFLQGLVRCSANGSKINVIEYGFPQNKFIKLESNITVD